MLLLLLKLELRILLKDLFGVTLVPLILPRDLSLKLNTAVLLELTVTTPVLFSMINMIRWKTKTINFLSVLQSALTTSLVTTVSFLRLISTPTLKINLN